MKLFSGAILHGVSKEPETYLSPSQTSARKHFCKIVNGYKALTIFTKLHRRCLTWFYRRLCEHNFIFNIFWKNIAYRKLIKLFKVLPKKN